MPIDGNYVPGERRMFCAVIDQAAVESHMRTGAVERYLYAIYDRETGRNVGHLWLNKTRDAAQFKDIPFGAIVQFEAEVAEYRARNGLFELRNVSQVKVLRAPTLSRVLEMHEAKDKDRLRRGVSPRREMCTCGKPAGTDRYRGYSRTGKSHEFCSELCRAKFLQSQA